jgi:hypothetical protein
MKRPLVILLGVLVIGAAIFTGSFYFSQRACADMMGGKDDLSWLQSEFHLGDAEMARVRQLHEGYLPQCMKLCAKIAAKKDEVTAALAGGTNVTAEVQKKLAELGELHAQCQAQMLQHFVDVSHAMPPEEGRRYLAEMERITIGLDGNEQAMSPSAHGNN